MYVCNIDPLTRSYIYTPRARTLGFLLLMTARAEQLADSLTTGQSGSPRQLLRLQLDSEGQPPSKATEAAQLLLAAN